MSAKNSSSIMTEQDNSPSTIYSNSMESKGAYAWIQPPINEQVLDPAHANLVDGIYVQVSPSDTDIDTSLAAMAFDPDIQRELHLIDSEFRVTESDGLSD